MIKTFITLLSLSFTSLVLAQNKTSLVQYVVVNQCPAPIDLYIGGVFDSTIPFLANVTKLLGPDAGFFYTDANGGTKDGSATRAGFFGEDGYYYMVVDPTHFNTGMSIRPVTPVNSTQPGPGFCLGIFCGDPPCSDVAFSQPPTAFSPPTSTPPAPPLFECPVANTSYVITFCDGIFPQRGQAIHPNFDTGKCLDVKGNVQANGTPVQIYDCNETGAQNWIINRGSTKVQLAGTNFCLDAGTNAANGVGMKIWQCYDNLPAQQWYYTDDNRIALEGQGFCLDLTNGVLNDGNILQTWKCTDFNTNQIWTLSAGEAF